MSELFQRLRLVSYLLDAIPIILFALTETVIIIYHMALTSVLCSSLSYAIFFYKSMSTGHTYLQ